ncbi:MAG: DUF4982 domain-containing protein, partial [Bacteroides sp.]|nr:DUF4982 domain-containing protein [Bacteroides sp.]
PRINNKGLVYSDRTPKDVYYYYKAAGRKDIPVLHIASRDWTRRAGIQQGETPVMLPIKVYTNLPEVELFIDGKSLGKQKVTNYTAIFDVPFSHKEHYVSAKAENREIAGSGCIIEDGIHLSFTPVPAQLNGINLRSLELAVNVGSNCFYTSDESQLTWVPDQPYTKGSWGYVGGESKNSQTQVENTNDGPLFQTLRNDIESYCFDVSNGVYEIEFLFTDVFRENAATAYQLGRNSDVESRENCFSIIINDETVEEDFSPCRESGYFHALRKRYNITNFRNKIEIRFSTRNGKSFLNGVKLRKLY